MTLERRVIVVAIVAKYYHRRLANREEVAKPHEETNEQRSSSAEGPGNVRHIRLDTTPQWRTIRPSDYYLGKPNILLLNAEIRHVLQFGLW